MKGSRVKFLKKKKSEMFQIPNILGVLLLEKCHIAFKKKEAGEKLSKIEQDALDFLGNTYITKEDYEKNIKDKESVNVK